MNESNAAGREEGRRLTLSLPRRHWVFVAPVLACVLMLSTLPIVPVSAQSRDYYDLEPSLHDKVGSYTWFTPPKEVNDLGYEGDFNFTLAVGNSSDDQLDNWAYWSFDPAPGRYEVQAYIPPQWATAHPQYLIWADDDGDGTYSNDEYVAGPYLNQASGSGWRTIGEYELSGDVRVEVRDVRARDDYRTVGAANARLAVDAMRLKRVTQSFPPGAVELASVNYEVMNRSNGSGRVTWGRVQEATSYDLNVTIGTENVNDGRTDEDEQNLTNVSCCSRTFSANSGWRITAVQVSVRAVNASGAGVWSAPIIAGVSYPVARPGAISGLRYDRSGSRIVWDPEPAATAYDVVWKQPTLGTSGDGVVSSSCSTSLCVQQITRVRHEALEYRVRAKNKNGTQFGPWSSWRTDEAETARPVEAPGAVGRVRWESGRIVWDEAARATAYDIEWRYQGETATRQSVNCSSSCSSGVLRDPTRQLEFRVRGKNGGGNGAWSAWANESAEIVLPGAVSNVGYRADQIAWSPASNAVAYDVEWRNEGQSVTRDSVTCNSSCSLAVDRVAGKRLEFRVRAKNDAGRGPWSAWVHETAEVAPISLPTAPRNVRLVARNLVVLGRAHEFLVITWDPPANAGGSPITAYTRVVTRPDGPDAKRFTLTRPYKSGHATFGALRPCTTYTVHIAAQNSTGTGPFATAKITTGSRGAPPAPVGLTVKAIEGADNRVRATWDLRDNSDTCGVGYQVRWSPAAGARSTTVFTRNQSAVFTGKSGVRYDVSVRSIRDGKTSQAIGYEDFVTLLRPIIEPIDHEKRWWIFKDAVVGWEPIAGVDEYALDWRYMFIDSERLNEIYSELNRGSLDANRRTNLENEANQLLDGTEVSATRIGGDSAPHPDSEQPEVHLWRNGLYTLKTLRHDSRSEEWDTNSDPIEFTIESRNDDYVLQARVRALGDGPFHGPWSDWVYHPNSRFSAGCRSLEFYESIKDALRAVEIGGWIVTVAGVVSAVVTAGTSTLAAQAIRTIAKQIALKLVRDLTLRKVLREIAKQALSQLTGELRSNFLRFIFGCAMYAVDGGLKVDNIGELGAEIIKESWNDIKKGTTWSDIQRDTLIDALLGK